MKLFAENHDI
jgi:hydroxymethylglutaryl-CoA synthase